MEIFILAGLIVLNGLFTMAEIALVSVRKSRLESQADKGNAHARKALELSENPEIFLSTAQIGITLIAILTGVYSGEKFSDDLRPYIEQIEMLAPYADGIATSLIVIIVTFLSIVFGELIPKRIGLLRAEKISILVAGPVGLLAKIAYPIVWLLNSTSNIFFRLFNIKRTKEDAVTEEEIKTMITEGTEAGTIDEAEQEIIERVFHLGDRNITSLMTHRSDIIWFDLNDTEEKMKEKILKEPHSVYPICHDSIDNLKGIVSLKDLYITEDAVQFKDIMRPALFVPENNTAYQVLEKFKTTTQHACFIVDEYGTLQGMITLNDILEAIVGELPQQDLIDYEVISRPDGTWLIDAQIPFYEFLDKFERTEWMNEGEHEFDTLAGFILHELEHIPQTGETIDWKGFRLEIIDMDGHRIDKVLVTPPEADQ